MSDQNMRRGLCWRHSDRYAFLLVLAPLWARHADWGDASHRRFIGGPPRFAPPWKGRRGYACAIFVSKRTCAPSLICGGGFPLGLATACQGRAYRCADAVCRLHNLE